MCIIVYKPKGEKLPNKNTLYKCFTNNKDGAGYTYAINNNVVIKKGFQNFNDFYINLLKDYKKNKLEKNNLVMHFRIGTSGGLTKEKTQPFTITNNIKELNKLYVKTKKSSLVHNGILYDFTYDAKNSDTQNYIKDFLQPLFASQIKDKTSLISETLGTSKLAILTKKDKVKLYGEFIEYDGIYYSNNSFNDYDNLKNSIKYIFKNDKKNIVQKYDAEYFQKQNNNSIWKWNYKSGEYYYD